MDTPTLISTSVYPGWKCNLRDNVSFIINNVVGGGLAKKMKVAVKGGAAVDPESGSGQRLNLPPSSLPSYPAGLGKVHLI